MKWNLRWAAARRDIWRPTDLLAAFKEVGFTPSLSKVSAMWGSQPVTVRLDDLDKICAALHCTVADLLEAEPVEAQERAGQDLPAAVGESGPGRSPARPTPRQHNGDNLRSLPPN
ncbi:helix-turn-helix transcriptional regulator [Kitasatospora sp. NPDC048545]|uniref:helix-turn-helix domain-containing protein n=1 Tax=Kitasatospora sp. NPDC048545 TaxID=3157208 RepID=UPI0033DB9D6D